MPGQSREKGQSAVFVVRFIVEGEEPDYKVFAKRDDAEKRFKKASIHAWRGDCESAAWFQVASAANARSAVEAVKNSAEGVVILGIEPRPLAPGDLGI